MTALSEAIPGLLNGRVALVTGASSGIGAATARALAAAGATVAVGARRTDRLEGLVREIAAAGGTAMAVGLDVGDESSCREGVQAVIEAYEALDIVVNNAGLMLLGPVEGADTGDWRRMIDTNVLGLMYMSHAALPHLLAGASVNEGKVVRATDVVNISSVAGRFAGNGSGVYNASKWAVNAFSESLRQEVAGRAVRVSLVEPGAVATELADHITHPGAKEAAESFYAGMQNLHADDIARAVLYIVTQPAHVAINELLVRPTTQE